MTKVNCSSGEVSVSGMPNSQATAVTAMMTRLSWLMRSAAWWATLCAISWPSTAARPSSPAQMGRMPLKTKTLPLEANRQRLHSYPVGTSTRTGYPGMTMAFFCFGSLMTCTSQFASVRPEAGIRLFSTFCTIFE